MSQYGGGGGSVSIDYLIAITRNLPALANGSVLFFLFYYCSSRLLYGYRASRSKRGRCSLVD